MNWNKLPLIDKALRSVTARVYHFDASGAQTPYAVWGEDGTGNEEHADNKLIARTLVGTIDYFTQNTADPDLQRIEDALEAAGIIYHLNSVQFEDDTGICHYEWTWELG